jgi:hypothetical protein
MGSIHARGCTGFAAGMADGIQGLKRRMPAEKPILPRIWILKYSYAPPLVARNFSGI